MAAHATVPPEVLLHPKRGGLLDCRTAVLLTFLSRDTLKVVPSLLPPGLQLPPHVRAALPDLLSRLHAEGKLFGMAIEDPSGPADGRVLGVGVSGFLTPSFSNAFLTRPRPFVTAAAYEAELRGERALLAEAEVAEPSAAGALTLLVLHYGQSVWLDDPRGMAILAMGHAAFRFTHEGYGIARVYQEAYGPQREFLRAGGMLMKSEYGADADALGQAAPEHRPCLMGLEAEDPESALPGTTVSFLFQRRTPRFAFSPAEQRLLLHALLLESDTHIARELDLSLNTLKSTWRSIYDRVEREDAGMFDTDSAGTDDPTSRGREKRRRLVEYLRLHMEELRPYPRRRAAR